MLNKLNAPLERYSTGSKHGIILDDIYPNAMEEEIMAARWFQAIKPYLKKYK